MGSYYLSKELHSERWVTPESSIYSEGSNSKDDEYYSNEDGDYFSDDEIDTNSSIDNDDDEDDKLSPGLDIYHEDEVQLAEQEYYQHNTYYQNEQHQKVESKQQNKNNSGSNSMISDKPDTSESGVSTPQLHPHAHHTSTLSAEKFRRNHNKSNHNKSSNVNKSGIVEPFSIEQNNKPSILLDASAAVAFKSNNKTSEQRNNNINKSKVSLTSSHDTSRHSAASSGGYSSSVITMDLEAADMALGLPTNSRNSATSPITSARRHSHHQPHHHSPHHHHLSRSASASRSWTTSLSWILNPFKRSKYNAINNSSNPNQESHK